MTLLSLGYWIVKEARSKSLDRSSRGLDISDPCHRPIAAIPAAPTLDGGHEQRGVGLAVDHAEHRAERAVGQGCIAAVADLHRREVKRAFGEADLSAPRLVHLGAGWHITITPRVKLLRIGPVNGIEAGRGVRRVM